MLNLNHDETKDSGQIEKQIKSHLPKNHSTLEFIKCLFTGKPLKPGKKLVTLPKFQTKRLTS